MKAPVTTSQAWAVIAESEGWGAKEAPAAITNAPAPVAQPVCPECSAELLYECVACSHTNYPKQQELRPASDPHGWLIQGSSQLQRGEFAEIDTKAEARRIGGTCYAYPVYRSPVAPQPLTAQQIKSMWAQCAGYAGGIIDFARAIEAAHGIKEVK